MEKNQEESCNDFEINEVVRLGGKDYLITLKANQIRLKPTAEDEEYDEE